MKNITIIVLISLLTMSIANSTIKTIETCENGKCTKQTIIEKEGADPVNTDELQEGKCLLNPKTNEISYIDGYDPKSHKLTTIQFQQKRSRLERSFVFTNSRLFNDNQVMVSCAGTLFGQSYMKECIAKSSKSTYSLFCIAPRKSNF